MIIRLKAIQNKNNKKINKRITINNSRKSRINTTNRVNIRNNTTKINNQSKNSTIKSMKVAKKIILLLKHKNCFQIRMKL